MKNRDYKEFGRGAFVHIFNRGNNREKLFRDEQDYRAFLFRLGLTLGFEQNELNKEKLLALPYSRIRITDTKKNIFRIHSFCLMPNHFHLLIEQCKDLTISKLVSKICTSYAMYMNKKYKRVGHVFQDQFKAVLMEDNPQLMWTSAYIHMNPVKDGLVKNPSEWQWSSYNDYAFERNLPIVHKDLLMGIFDKKDDFKKETSQLFFDENSMSRGILDIE